MDTQLVLQPDAFDIVTPTETAVVFDMKLRHQEQRNATGAFGCIGQAGENQMNDVFGQVVLAVGDENLGAGNTVGAVAGRLGLSLDQRQIGTGMGLGQVHGARPGT